jgi:hypothetical protein
VVGRTLLVNPLTLLAVGVAGGIVAGYLLLPLPQGDRAVGFARLRHEQGLRPAAEGKPRRPDRRGQGKRSASSTAAPLAETSVDGAGNPAG